MAYFGKGNNDEKIGTFFTFPSEALELGKAAVVRPFKAMETLPRDLSTESGIKLSLKMDEKKAREAPIMAFLTANSANSSVI